MNFTQCLIGAIEFVSAAVRNSQIVAAREKLFLSRFCPFRVYLLLLHYHVVDVNSVAHNALAWPCRPIEGQ
jgi:hypothetical protein